MSLFTRSAPERRDWIPPIPLNSETGTFQARGVNLSQTESALQQIAVYASVRLLREVVQSLPLDLYTTNPDGTSKQIAMPVWLSDLGGQQYGLADFMSQVLYSDAMRGNVVAKIKSRDPQSAKPRQLSLVHPDNVSVHTNPDGYPEWHINGQSVRADDVFHRRSFAIPGSIWGLSPIGTHALTIGLGMSAEQFGAQFFMDGGHPTAIFKNTAKTLDADSTTTIKQRIKAMLAGNREPVVLGADWEYQAIQVTPNESQFLQTQNYTDAQCARIFGPGMPQMLGYETGGSLTYANIEQANIQLLTFTLDPWLVRLERMIYDLLPRPQYVKFNRGALLRTDLTTRFRAHEIALRNEFEVVNEVRALEDLPPVAWGDEPTATKTAPPVPVQMEQ